MELVKNEQIEALAKLSAEMRRITKGKHFEKFEFKVYEFNQENFWQWLKEKQASVKYLERLINGAIENDKTDHARSLIFLNSQLTLAEEMYFKVIMIDSLIKEKDNIIMELGKENIEIGKKAASAVKELEQLKSNL